MKIDDYQRKAHGFARYGENVEYPFLGLAEEAGEVVGKRAKFIRKHEGVTPEKALEFDSASQDRNDAHWFQHDLAKELGDVCWMVAEIATAFGLSLEEIMQGNIEKLYDRRARGVIIGEGDNR